MPWDPADEGEPRIVEFYLPYGDVSIEREPVTQKDLDDKKVRFTVTQPMKKVRVTEGDALKVFKNCLDKWPELKRYYSTSLDPSEE